MWSNAFTHMLIVVLILVVLIGHWYPLVERHCRDKETTAWPSESVRVAVSDAAKYAMAAMRTTSSIDAIRFADESVAIVETLLRLGYTTEQFKTHCHISIERFLAMLRSNRDHLTSVVSEKFPGLRSNAALDPLREARE